MLKSRDSTLAPDYLRIPHVAGFSSNKTSDDLEVELPRRQLGKLWVQEKVDAANCGVSWTDEPLFRNRSKILRKAFDGRKDTPAKKQFTSAWNWMYEHEDAIREVQYILGPSTIYGEWCWAEHSIHYDRLPDWFLAYDIWVEETQKFVSPARMALILGQTDIAFIEPRRLSGPAGIQDILDLPSDYRTGAREGVVLKTTDAADEWITGHYKIVRPDFVRMDDGWNDRPMKRNKLAR